MSYKISIWNLEKGQVITKFEEFTDSKLKAIFMLPNIDDPYRLGQSENTRTKHKTNFKFVSVEDSSIKFWKLDDFRITITKKINVKQTLISATASETLGFLFVLGQNGKVLVLDTNGEYVSSISRSGALISSISTTYEDLYLGTNTGSIYSCKVSSLIAAAETDIEWNEIHAFSDSRSPLDRYGDLKYDMKGYISEIISSRDGKRGLISMQNGNFYILNYRAQRVDQVYISQGEDEMKEIKWVQGSHRNYITPNHEVYLEKAKIADLGVWEETNKSRPTKHKMIWEEPLYKPAERKQTKLM